MPNEFDFLPAFTNPTIINLRIFYIFSRTNAFHTLDSSEKLGIYLLSN
jgi:hypothetical protein